LNTFFQVVKDCGGEGLALVLAVVTLPCGHGLNIWAAALTSVVVIATAVIQLRAFDLMTVASVPPGASQLECLKASDVGAPGSVVRFLANPEGVTGMRRRRKRAGR
jgi:hypothetical protein